MWSGSKNWHSSTRIQWVDLGKGILARDDNAFSRLVFVGIIRSAFSLKPALDWIMSAPNLESIAG